MGLALSPGVALVAGGTGSLGDAICRRLSQTGTAVLIGYHSRANAAQMQAECLVKEGLQAQAIKLDLGSIDDITAALVKADQLGGGLGTLVYASGAQPNFDFLSAIDNNEWRRVMEIEIFGLLNLIKAALPKLREARGAIVTIATYQANRLEPRGGLSVIPKAAAEKIMAITAREEARFGVRANTVRAGWMEGGFGVRMVAEGNYREKIREKIPLRRFGLPEEIADAVAFLASTRSGFTTGATLTIDGGLSL